ncbi:MAG: 3'-5' exonuclease [Nitrospirota bacterium]
MGILANLVSKFLGSGTATQPERLPPSIASPASGLTVTVSFPGKSQPSVDIPDEEVASVVSGYAYVLSNQLDILKPADRWFDEVVQKRRLRDDSETQYEWLIPFLALEFAKLDRLKSFQSRGPSALAEIAKVFRALIRERRKTKQPCNDLLRALYGTCILNDFLESLAFESTVPQAMTGYVDIHELQRIHVDYSMMGYEHISSLSKTDIKWLVEAFGEPVKYPSPNNEFPHVRNRAVSRYCWEQLRRENETAASLGRSQKPMNEWLYELAKQNLEISKDFLARSGERQARRDDAAAEIEAAIAATRGPFAVADLETTGLMVENAEILELAALLVDPDGSVTSEFSMLVKIQCPVPADIARLTGISQSEVDMKGQTLAFALEAFIRHVGERPIFFHNAPFDQAFLKAACLKTNQCLANQFYDTLPLARHSWPSLSTHKLAALAEHVGGIRPNHRGLGDAHATLAVLLAARDSVG